MYNCKQNLMENKGLTNTYYYDIDKFTSTNQSMSVLNHSLLKMRKILLIIFFNKHIIYEKQAQY